MNNGKCSLWLGIILLMDFDGETGTACFHDALSYQMNGVSEWSGNWRWYGDVAASMEAHEGIA